MAGLPARGRFRTIPILRDAGCRLLRNPDRETMAREGFIAHDLR
jgi:hypothetical protein